MGIFFSGHMAHFFEQRHIHKRRGITLRTGIAIPVPGTTKVPALFKNAYICNACFFKPRPCHQARKAATNEGNRHMISLRLAFYDGGIGVFQIMG